MRRKAPFTQPRHCGIVTPFCRARRETRAWVGCYHKNALGLLPRAPRDVVLGRRSGVKSPFQLFHFQGFGAGRGPVGQAWRNGWGWRAGGGAASEFS